MKNGRAGEFSEAAKASSGAVRCSRGLVEGCVDARRPGRHSPCHRGRGPTRGDIWRFAAFRRATPRISLLAPTAWIPTPPEASRWIYLQHHLDPKNGGLPVMSGCRRTSMPRRSRSPRNALALALDPTLRGNVLQRHMCMTSRWLKRLSVTRRHLIHSIFSCHPVDD
jgi:hypothetical protein